MFNVLADRYTQICRFKDGASRLAESHPEQEDMPSGVGKAVTRLLHKVRSEEPGSDV